MRYFRGQLPNFFFLLVYTILLFGKFVHSGGYGDSVYSTYLHKGYYKEPFHPDVVRDYKGEHYYRHIPSQPREIRIRHLKLNQYLWTRRDIESHVNRVVLNHSNWATFFVHSTREGQIIEQAYAPRFQCLSAFPLRGYRVITDECNVRNYNEKWKLVPNKYGHFHIQQKGTPYCLQPALDISYPTLIQMRVCDPFDSQQLWEVSDAYLYY